MTATIDVPKVRGAFINPSRARAAPLLGGASASPYRTSQQRRT